MFIFGGSTGSAKDDFFEYRTDTSRWTPITPTGTSTATADATTTTTTAGSSGGRDRQSLSGSESSFALRTSMSGSMITGNNENSSSGSGSGAGDSILTPVARFCHIACVYDDAMYIFGGYDGANRLNDFLRYKFVAIPNENDVPRSSLVRFLYIYLYCS